VKANIKSIDGVETRILSAGDGPPLFLLHGVGLSADCFVKNIDPLAQRFSVIAPDLLGHGFTAAVDYRGVAPQVEMARHVLGVADALGLGQFSVAGSSFGALVAALIYFMRADTVDKLVLIGSGSVFHSTEDQRRTLTASQANGVAAMSNPTLAGCRQRLANIVYSATCIPDEMLLAQLTAYAYPDRIGAYRDTISGAIASLDDPEARVISRLEHLGPDTLVIVGRNDMRADWNAHASGVKRMPRAALEIYDDCGHLPFLEHPNLFNSQVDAFLANASRVAS